MLFLISRLVLVCQHVGVESGSQYGDAAKEMGGNFVCLCIYASHNHMKIQNVCGVER